MAYRYNIDLTVDFPADGILESDVLSSDTWNDAADYHDAIEFARELAATEGPCDGPDDDRPYDSRDANSAP